MRLSSRFSSLRNSFSSRERDIRGGREKPKKKKKRREKAREGEREGREEDFPPPTFLRRKQFLSRGDARRDKEREKVRGERENVGREEEHGKKREKTAEDKEREREVTVPREGEEDSEREGEKKVTGERERKKERGEEKPQKRGRKKVRTRERKRKRGRLFLPPLLATGFPSPERERGEERETGEKKEEKRNLEGGEISPSSCYARARAGEQGGENAEGRKREEM